MFLLLMNKIILFSISFEKNILFSILVNFVFDFKIVRICFCFNTVFLLLDYLVRQIWKGYVCLLCSSKRKNVLNRANRVKQEKKKYFHLTLIK